MSLQKVLCLISTTQLWHHGKCLGCDRKRLLWRQKLWKMKYPIAALILSVNWFSIRYGILRFSYFGSKIINILSFRRHLQRNRIVLALKKMEELPNFSRAFHSYLQDKARSEANGIVQNKDKPRKNFTLDDVKCFSYSDQLRKYVKVKPQ